MFPSSLPFRSPSFFSLDLSSVLAPSPSRIRVVRSLNPLETWRVARRHRRAAPTHTIYLVCRSRVPREYFFACRLSDLALSFRLSFWLMRPGPLGPPDRSPTRHSIAFALFHFQRLPRRAVLRGSTDDGPRDEIVSKRGIVVPLLKFRYFLRAIWLHQPAALN